MSSPAGAAAPPQGLLTGSPRGARQAFAAGPPPSAGDTLGARAPPAAPAALPPAAGAPPPDAAAPHLRGGAAKQSSEIKRAASNALIAEVGPPPYQATDALPWTCWVCVAQNDSRADALFTSAPELMRHLQNKKHGCAPRIVAPPQRLG